MAEPSVAAHITNFSWTAAGAWSTFAALMGIIIRQWIPWKKITTDANLKLIETLSIRVDNLEKENKEQRQDFTRKIDKLVADNEAKVERMLADHERTVRIMRHDMANVTTRFDALVMFLKRIPNPPEMLIAILEDIENMKREQDNRMAVEKGIAMGAKIDAIPALENYR